MAVHALATELAQPTGPPTCASVPTDPRVAGVAEEALKLLAAHGWRFDSLEDLD